MRMEGRVEREGRGEVGGGVQSAPVLPLAHMDFSWRPLVCFSKIKTRLFVCVFEK